MILNLYSKRQLKKGENQSMSKGLSWDQVYSKYENFVKYKRTEFMKSNYGLTEQDSEDLIQEGLFVLYNCYQKYKHLDEGQFHALVMTSIKNAMLAYVKKRNVVTEYDATLEDNEYKLGQEQEIKEYGLDADLVEDLKILSEHLKSPLAKAVLLEMINPSPRTRKIALADMYRRKFFKKLGKKINGKTVAVPKSCEIKIRHIQRALNVSSKQIARAREEIQETAKKLQKEGICFGF